MISPPGTFLTAKSGGRLFTTLAIVSISGCASIPDTPKEVRIPVPVPCLSASDLPAKPDFVTDAALSVMTDGDLILSLAADRRQNQGYRAELESLLQACTK